MSTYAKFLSNKFGSVKILSNLLKLNGIDFEADLSNLILNVEYADFNKLNVVLNKLYPKEVWYTEGIKALGGKSGKGLIYVKSEIIEVVVGNNYFYDVKDLVNKLKLKEKLKFNLEHVSYTFDGGCTYTCNDQTIEFIKNNFEEVNLKKYKLPSTKYVPYNKIFYKDGLMFDITEKNTVEAFVIELVNIASFT